MDMKTLLFSFEGRINRAKYWLTVLANAIVWIVVGILALILMGVLGQGTGGMLAILFGVAGFGAAMWIGIAAGIKRLHDREKSGWWLLVFFLVPGVLSGIGQAVGGIVQGVGALAGLAISIWMIVELGCLKGTTGPNMYGPDPLPPAS